MLAVQNSLVRSVVTHLRQIWQSMLMCRSRLLVTATCITLLDILYDTFRDPLRHPMPQQNATWCFQYCPCLVGKNLTNRRQGYETQRIRPWC